MAPVPVFLAITCFKLAVIGVRAMVIDLPTRVWFPLVRTPGVIIAMRSVVVACMYRTSGNDYLT